MKILHPILNFSNSKTTSNSKNDFSTRNTSKSFIKEQLYLNKTGRLVSFSRFYRKANVNLLDCTLRDGGFINNWTFGFEKILDIFKNLDKSNVDVIEVGYLYNKSRKSLNKTRYPNTNAIAERFASVKEKKAMVSAMIDYGDLDIKNVGLKKDSFIDIIRLTFKKEKADEAIEFAKHIKEKGYDLWVQPTSITSYSKEEMIDLIKKVNALNPKVVSIVDTYGLLDKTELNKYFNLLDKNLSENINIGFHAHNNLQLGFSNAVELLQKKSSRKLYVDATLYGMGKSAGNTPTELISMEMDKRYGKKYDISRMLEMIDKYVSPAHGKNKWGYSLMYFISALNACHPNYVSFLRDKNLPCSQINDILKTISKDKKLQFDKSYIEDLYSQFTGRQ